MKNTRMAAGLLAVALQGAGMLSVQAQGPNKINFQGRLADGTNLFSGAVGLQLRVYTNAAGGAFLYEDSNTVTVVDGVYSTFIGDNTTFGTLNTALAAPRTWVEVVADGQVFSPRYELAAVPYALNSPATANFVQKTGDSMTGPLAVDASSISSPNAAYELGGGVSLRATAAPGASWAVGVRGRVSQTDPSFATRSIRGVTGVGNTVGGPSTTVNGGYFNAKVYASATDGILALTGVGADAEVEPGAAGFNPLQTLIGGRFGAAGANAGLANAYGVLAHSVEVHDGDNQGVIGIARGSRTSNVGVGGAANASDSQLQAVNVNSNGVGVYAFNPDTNGFAFYADGASNMINGSLVVSNTLIAGRFVGDGSGLTNLVGGGGPETDPVWLAQKPGYLATNVAAATYVKKAGDAMTGALAVDASNISSPNAAYELGGGVSLRATAAPGASWAVGVRGRVSQTDPSFATRSIRGVTGAGSSVGGPSTTVNGGYFNAKVYAGATDGILALTGVGADAEVEPGATGFNPLQALIGGRFGAAGSNAGLAKAYGVVAHSVEVHDGDNQGVIGIARGSRTSNVGVGGAANASDSQMQSITVSSNGVGVYAYNPDPLGYALYANGPSNMIGGSLVVSNTLTAGRFVGDGAGLTNVPGAGTSTNYVKKIGDNMTGNLALDLTGISSPTAAYELGGGLSLRASPLAGATYAVGIRGRVSQTDASLSARSLRGVAGIANSIGGPSTTVNGGYFNAKIYASATDGVLGLTGVAADAEVEPGATGFNPLQLMIGGRFGAAASNAGLMRAVGVMGHATEAHLGDNLGAIGIARNSTNSNIGVAGVANLSDAQIQALNGLPQGAGVYANNGNLVDGYGVYALGASNYFSGVVNSDGGFAAAGAPGLTTNIVVTTPSGSNTLIFSKGILIGVQ